MTPNHVAKFSRGELSAGRGVKANYVHCKYHPGAELVEDDHAGDLVCSECGLVVVDRVIDMSCEWRSFQDDDKDRSRVGQAENPMLECDLSTVIAGPGFETKQKNTEGQAMRAAYMSVVDMCSRIHAGKVIADDAFQQFKVIKESDPCRGRDKEVIMWCCVYNSCRAAGKSRSLNEIVVASRRTKKEFTKALKFISKKLLSKDQKGNNTPVQPDEQQERQQQPQNMQQNQRLEITHNPLIEFMPRFCNLLGLSFEVQKVATKIAERAVKKSLGGGSLPTTLASAILFIASDLCHCKKSLNDISGVTGVSASAIKISLKNMAPHLKSICVDHSSEVKRQPS